jgi:hypothetical protein
MQTGGERGGVMDDSAKQRLAELHAAAPAKHKKTALFAMMSLPAAAKAFAAMNCSKAMVYVWLVHKARTTGKKSVAVPNGVLARYGVGRLSKYRALRQLETAGLITVEWRSRKTPAATLLRGKRQG